MIRRFVDADGVAWRVWDVHTSLEFAPPGKGNNWLCFESATGRRRLTPIPACWAAADSAVLNDLCATARVVPKLALTHDAGPKITQTYSQPGEVKLSC